MRASIVDSSFGGLFRMFVLSGIGRFRCTRYLTRYLRKRPFDSVGSEKPDSVDSFSAMGYTTSTVHFAMPIPFRRWLRLLKRRFWPAGHGIVWRGFLGSVLGKGNGNNMLGDREKGMWETLGLHVEKNNQIPMYRQLYFQLRELVLSGRLPASSRLPRIRELAGMLGIARNTVEAAYRQLSVEGLVHAKRGVGYTVAEIDLDALGAHGQGQEGGSCGLSEKVEPNYVSESDECSFSFTYGNRLAEEMPFDLWRMLANEALSQGPDRNAAIYTDPFGLPGLREQLANYLKRSRGIVCSPSQIVLQPGTQPALASIAMLFDERNRSMAIENPGYSEAFPLLETIGCRLTPIPVYEEDGVQVSSLQRSGASMYFCTPSNQYPLGFTMPLGTRLKIVDWARSNASYILEDDYCCEFRYDSAPIPSLFSLAPDNVVYMGTFSKALTPAARMSYLVLPMGLMERWRQVYRFLPSPMPWLDQRVMELFFEKGHWDRYIRTTVRLFRKRRRVLAEAIDSYLGDRVDVLGQKAGMHVLVGDKENRPQSQLIELAKGRGVCVTETDRFWSTPDHPMSNYVMLGYSSIATEDIAEGVRSLAAAWYGG